MILNMDGALQTFIVESKELLQEMEDCLLRLEAGDTSPDMVAAIFRAAHTIKGSSGLFGLEPIVQFTHTVEDLLDHVRNGEVQVSSPLIAALLECGDHMQNLVETVAVQGKQPDEALDTAGRILSGRLTEFKRSTGQLDLHVDAFPSHCLNTCWHVSIRFGSDVLSHGMDPASFLNYLGQLGEIVQVYSIADSLPGLDQMDPESCYWGYEIALRADVERAELAAAFEFIESNSIVKILPPQAKLEDYITLIDQLPEDNSRLGEILVAIGALTEQELVRALAQQKLGASISDKHTPLGEILVESQGTAPDLINSALAKQSGELRAKETVYVRVHAEKLDGLINLVGELVIAGAGANLLAKSCNNDALAEATSNISDLVEDIRDRALKLRMVPIGDTFNRFQRVVRDVSKELGKRIELKISGAETELDKTVVEKIGDPLMHLIRNAMDHGIETPEDRVSAGKPASGVLHLNAYHESGSIVIEISDDGRGLDKDRILAKALEKELIPASAALSDQEIFNLIFEPGFSTAAAVTNLSGRGVGMDVVKRNIMALRGTVELESLATIGTTVRIRLPLTLAIIDGFLVNVGSSSYVIPLEMVQECIELSDEERQRTRERSYLNLRGEVLPLVFLRDHFMVEGPPSRRANVVVVHVEDRKAGLVVDELQGEFQTVIKPLGKLFSSLRGISGSTILGNGTVALILDIPALAREINKLEPALRPHQPNTAVLQK